ncbi:hypothetical protein CICLE_v10027220mg [Citrus x clementina]|uniref:Uncharacterized protein n=1 Tax=Citrus clementina TaxID=85681 RepID=V4S1P7_CITCL|nr:hypothetical protein CICLE_v10027220mg [Citrus x clementina]
MPSLSSLLRVGFEPTPFRTRTLIWRLRPTRPSQHFMSWLLAWHCCFLRQSCKSYKNTPQVNTSHFL